MSKAEDTGIAARLQNAHAEFEQGHWDTAEAAFQNILTLEPQNADARYFLAIIAYQSGRPAEALRQVRQAIASRPHSADCHNLHGVVSIALERHEEACAALRKAIDCEPTFADAHNNLGAALEPLGRFEEADTAYRHALTIQPDYAQAYNNLGRVMLALGQPVEAEEAYRQAFLLDSGLADARVGLAVAQQRQGAVAAAETTIEDALTADPDHAELYRYLGALRHGRGNLHGAETALRAAINLKPELSIAHDNLAGVLLDRGRIEEAETCFLKSIALDPRNSRAHANLLLCRNYYCDDPRVLFKDHQTWAEQHAAPIAEISHPTVRAASERLRVGYVSSDFRRHSVAYFLEPLLLYRDHSHYETFCYANLENPDETTARLREHSDNWRWVAGLNDDQLAVRIREDSIDILIDLSGHSAGNRLLTFQRRPAPVQATWLGYPNTTGLSAIDYRITDAVADPPGAETFHTESLVRLENGFLSYTPPHEAPDVTPLPAGKSGRVTFGSFNNLRKITPDVIKLWGEILRRAPTAGLLLKARSFADQATKARFIDAFEKHGINGERLVLRGSVTSPDEHLRAYADMDIALDPFPYNGTTTTCEALWMGVPVVTLAGNRHAGRVGASLLTQAGLESYIATQQDEYVSIALDLAQNVDVLSATRHALRENIKRSPLCDGAGFCSRMEAAYKNMWQFHQESATREP